MKRVKTKKATSHAGSDIALWGICLEKQNILCLVISDPAGRKAACVQKGGIPGKRQLHREACFMGLCSDQLTQLGRIPCHKPIAGKVIKALFCAWAKPSQTQLPMHQRPPQRSAAPWCQPRQQCGYAAASTGGLQSAGQGAACPDESGYA